MASLKIPKPPPVAPTLNPADAAVARRSSLGLPDELKPHCDAILAGFRAYESGNDEDARTALAKIPLGSPFLEWKVLLRGLMAYTSNDDGRALENWSRLSNEQLPSQLAAPLRAKLDPSFRPGQSFEQNAALLRRAELLIDTPLAISITALRTEIRRGKSLVNAFRTAESVAVRCKHDDPVVFKRIARLFYRAILDHGEPADIPRYRKVFSKPSDDPEFLKLEAQRFEHSDSISEANTCWSLFERWLSSNPLKWPEGLVRRARAVILHRIANNIEEDDQPSLVDEFRRILSRATLPNTLLNLPPIAEDPVAIWQKACELSPEWEPPARALFDFYSEQKNLEQAKAVAQRFLAHQPTALWAVEGLADLFARNGEARAALDLWLQALRANPLDRDYQIDVARAYVSTVRVELMEGDFARAEATLIEGETYCKQSHPTSWKVLRSVVARCAKQVDLADALQVELESDREKLPVTRFHFAASAVLAKWKPVQKKAVDFAFAESLAEPASPTIASYLLVSLADYIEYGIDYRGRAAHQKKIVAYALSTAESDAPIIDIERIAIQLQIQGEWTAAQKFAAVCSRRFPLNPVFTMTTIQALLAKAKGKQPPRSLFRLVQIARRNIERSTEPRHKSMLEIVEKMGTDLFNGFNDFF